MRKLARILRKEIRQAFEAFAYQHGGEMLSMREKGRMLSGDSINQSENKN